MTSLKDYLMDEIGLDPSIAKIRADGYVKELEQHLQKFYKLNRKEIGDQQGWNVAVDVVLRFLKGQE